MAKYKFNVKELSPVESVELVGDEGVMFWYTGEDTEYGPFQQKVEYGYLENIPRPLLRDAKIKHIYRESGEEACIRHINTRIANYLLDEYEANLENAPDSVIKLLERKIDIFYKWFWQRRETADKKLFGRFLRHVKRHRGHSEKPATWFTLKEAAEYARTGVTKLREIIDEGKLKSYRLDDAKSKSTILINRKDLDAMILFDRSTGLTKRQQERLASYLS